MPLRGKSIPGNDLLYRKSNYIDKWGSRFLLNSTIFKYGVAILMAVIAIFIDGANMFYAQKLVKYFVDYKKVKEHFSKGNELFKSYFFYGETSPPAVKDKRFLDYLIYQCDYTVRAKRIKTVVDDATGNEKQKCNLDIEMVVEMFKEIDHYDTAILMSGDGDFESVVELLKSRGKKVEVVSTRGMLARELANVAHRLHYLEDLKHSISRIDRQFGEPKVEGKTPTQVDINK